AKAETILARLDENEDELISRDEMLPDRVDSPYFGPAAVDDYGNMGGRAQPVQSFVQIASGQPIDVVVRAVMTRYNKGKNGKLSRQEIGLPKAEFDALDVNKDGYLDAKELAVFIRRIPDLELIARPGPVLQKQGVVEDAVREISSALGYKMSLARHIDLINPRS